jgi:hypothetical protein
MARFFYVKSGFGTLAAAPAATTQLTGPFSSMTASQVYPTFYDVEVYNTFLVDDVVCISDAHVDAETTNRTFVTKEGVLILSVDDANCEQYSSGAVLGNSSNWLFSGSGGDYTMSIAGLNFSGNAFQNSFNSSRIHIYECEFDMNMIGIWLSGSGSGFVVDKCTFIGAAGDYLLNMASSNDVQLRRISAGVGHVKSTKLLQIGTTNGVYSLRISDTDIASLVADSSTLLDVYNINHLLCTIERCKLPASFTVVGSLASKPAEINMTECDTGDGYHYFYFENKFGVVEEDTTTYLNATYDGTNGFSASMESSANCSTTLPLRYKLLTIPTQDLTSGATYEVEFTCANTLTDSDFYIEVEHQDNTDQALGVIASSKNADIFLPAGGGTEHSTSSASWTSPATNKYKDSVTIGSLANVDNSNVTVYAVLTKPSETVNVDPAVTVT